MNNYLYFTYGKTNPIFILSKGDWHSVAHDDLHDIGPKEPSYSNSLAT